MNIIISGAGRGIGSALASAFDEVRNNLALISKSGNLSYIPKNAKYINIKSDLSSFKETESAYNEIVNKFGEIEILLNNAGIGVFKNFADFSEEEFQTQFSNNLNHVFKLSSLAIKNFLLKKKGLIININSVSSIKAFPYSSVYAASKAAMLAMSRSMREETRDSGIKIIDVLLGATNTDIWDADSREKFGDRFLLPIDVAHSIKSITDLSLERNVYIEELVLRPQLGDL